MTKYQKYLHHINISLTKTYSEPSFDHHYSVTLRSIFRVDVDEREQL